jgi:hypothetical protein
MTIKKKLLPWLVIGAAGCGGDDEASSGALVGTWRGDLPGMTMTIEIKNQLRDLSGAEAVVGILSSSHKKCLSNAPVSGTLTKSTVQLVAIGSGTASQSTAVELSGELADGRITGLVTIEGDEDVEGCEIIEAPIRLAR